MKSFITLLLLLPFFATAQLKQKPKVVTPAHNPADGFVIDGVVTGYPDKTTVELLNGSTGVTEVSGTITANKFTLKGNVPSPDFKILIFNRKPPFITLFLDNSAVKVKGAKATIE